MRIIFAALAEVAQLEKTIQHAPFFHLFQLQSMVNLIAVDVAGQGRSPLL